MNQSEFAVYQARQADLKQFIQVLTPLCGINPTVDPEVQKLVNQKLTELIKEIHIGPKESVIKTLARA